MNINQLIETAHKIVTEFHEMEEARGSIANTYVNPFTQTTEENGVTVRISLLRELEALFKQKF